MPHPFLLRILPALFMLALVAPGHAETHNPKTCTITSTTALKAPDGTPDTRVVIAVGETVTFTTEQSASWTATTGTPKTGTGVSFTWKADCEAGKSTITATYPGHQCSITMKVIEPTGLAWKKDTDLNSQYAANVQGAGMLLTIKVTPLNVNFAAIQMREKSGPASDRTGTFANFPEGQPFHDASGQGKPFGAWAGVKNTGNDVDAKDTAASPAKPKPYWDGKFTWDIENQWKCKDAGDDTAKKFTNTKQTFTLQGANGYLKVSKGGIDHDRTPTP